ncbi:MAG: TonB-dependent receptor, partial [Calditrichaeota bacterium]
MKLFYRFLWIVLIASIPAMGYAQGVTTASIRGIVTDSKGEPLPGANVVAKHLPTGTVFGAATRTDGRFNIANVRVGGPYQITVTFIGYKPATRKNVYLSLGEVQNFKFTLIEEALQLGEVTVVGERNAVFSESHIGTATSVSTEEIERLPTIQRSIQDFARLTPQVVTTNIGQSDNIGGMTVAGKNNRENNFQVDGAILNDAFGLAASHTPGGQANLQPISLDAIQEFQVSIAPYDVRQGAFAGGLINAITRSGTNQFKGSAYFFGRNESFVGDLAGQSFKDFDDFNTGFR